MALRLALTFCAVRAQLMPEAPTDPEELQRLIQAEGLLADEPVPSTKLTSPTLCDSSVTQHAGYLDVALGTKYFFWMFESRSAPKTDPLVLWLTGGPGCSSQLALLAENGPCNMAKNGTGTEKNPYSWTSNANVIWVDQPAATGFSTGLPLVHDENGVAENMYNFMQEFYKALPQYKSLPFFIFGESYAGHYVPAVSHYIWQQNQGQAGFKIPLKGLGIGNGLTDPEVQYKAYPDMAYDGGKSKGGTLEKGVIGRVGSLAMQAASIPCVKQIASCNAGQTDACTTAYALCNYAELIPYQLTGHNPYDMRIKCEKVESYLNDKTTQSQLGVNKKWGSCNRLVNLGFQHDWMLNYQNKLPDLLKSGLKVLIYAGDVDYICNWLGNKEWTLAMDWSHKSEFNAAEDKEYQVEGKAAGRLRSSNGFHFMQVYQAGHMVPMDQPAVARQMLNDFIQGKFDETTELVV